jgi:hypothetical protein
MSQFFCKGAVPSAGPSYRLIHLLRVYFWWSSISCRFRCSRYRYRWSSRSYGFSTTSMFCSVSPSSYSVLIVEQQVRDSSLLDICLIRSSNYRGAASQSGCLGMLDLKWITPFVCHNGEVLFKSQQDLCEKPQHPKNQTPLRVYSTYSSTST